MDGTVTGEAPYPRDIERAITLKDGSRVRLRPIRPDDAPRLIDLYSRLSEDTAYQRFFTVMRRLPVDWAHYLSNVDYRERLAIVAEPDPPEPPGLIAVARYEPSDRTGAAEVAFVVQDAWQGKGIGTILLHDLLGAAAARGIERFRAYVLSTNVRMLDLLTRFTLITERQAEHGIVSLVFTRRPDAPVPHG